MKKNILTGFIMLAGLAVVLLNCTKPAGNLHIPPEQAHFANETSGAYFITAPGVTYEIQVGVTTVSDKDRTINFSVTSPTGAVQGTDYTLSGTSVTIPKGETLGTITVSGQYNNYTAGQKDTLIFTLEGPGVTPSDYNSTFKLLMRGPCFDGDVTDITLMGGTYANATDPDDPVYTVIVSNFVTTPGSTTATAKIANLWDWFGAVDIEFDWTDPANPKATIPLQTTDKFYSAADNQPFAIRTSPGQVSKFSVCTDKISLIVDLIVLNYPDPGQGVYYEQNYPMTINR